MARQLLGVEIDLAQPARRITLGLVVEVRTIRVSALASRADGHRPHPGPELHGRHEAVAAGPVVPLGPWVALRPERGQRAPLRRSEGDGDRRSVVAERLHDVAGQAL